MGSTDYFRPLVCNPFFACNMVIETSSSIFGIPRTPLNQSFSKGMGVVMWFKEPSCLWVQCTSTTRKKDAPHAFPQRWG
jgi:hypothetical protein